MRSRRKLLWTAGAVALLLVVAASQRIAGGPVTLSSNLTANRIPKATGGSTLANSLLDDGGTAANTLTYSGSGGLSVSEINCPFTDGVLPCVGASGDGLVLSKWSKAIAFLASSGNGAFLNLDTAAMLGWSPNTNILTSPDTALSRDAPGVVDVGNGVAGDKSGTVKAAVLNGGLPNCANVTVPMAQCYFQATGVDIRTATGATSIGTTVSSLGPFVPTVGILDISSQTGGTVSGSLLYSIGTAARSYVDLFACSSSQCSIPSSHLFSTTGVGTSTVMLASSTQFTAAQTILAVAPSTSFAVDVTATFGGATTLTATVTVIGYYLGAGN